LIDNAPDALNTFNKIAIVIQNNANRIDEIYRLLGSNVSVEELNNKLDDINSKLDSIDINNIITVLDDKAS
jgi:Ca2+-binding EF-hand superfamily protein